MPDLRFKDTLSGETASLPAEQGGIVGIYACGPTIYSRIHIGNARPFVVFSLLARFLRFQGYDPRLVINVTDVNDKIYAAAATQGMGSAELAEEMTRRYVEDTDRLGLGRPDDEPLATETVPEIIELIESLIAGDHAYESGGDVYFRVRSFEGYGKLSGREPDQMDQGEEAGTASLKHDRLDFALWKATKDGEDTSWPSPWGPGRPGWHSECSAMAEKLLGADFAIHGGGLDLIFPHHENEIAQTEAARGVPLARVWMHNGMVRTDEEKMSKSVGNIFLLHEALDAYGPEAVVAFLASAHYRQPVEFSDDALTESAARVARIRNFLLEPAVDGEEDPLVAERRGAMLEALADDFNTPRAFAAIFEIIAEGNRRPLPGAREALVGLLPLLGLETLADQSEGPGEEAERLLAERESARAERDFERADKIRDQLTDLGFEIRDSADGPRLVPRG
ncbi:cysteine--tRNA ligase [soil metagenome]